VVLFAAAGFGVQHFFGIREALPVGLLAGLILARFVPANTACSIESRRPEQE
jgi:hypothetical protein